MTDNTKRRVKPPAEVPVEKTIGPETFQPPQSRQYKLKDDFRPPVNADIVTQAELQEIADLEAQQAYIEGEITAKRKALLDRLQSKKACVAPGTFTACVVPHWKQQRVSWQEAFVEYNGQAEADKLKAQATGGKKEISSYSVEIKRIDGGGE